MSPTVDEGDPDLSPLGFGMEPRATAREGVAAGAPPVFTPSVQEYRGTDFPDLRRELGMLLGGIIVVTGVFIIGVLEWADRKRRRDRT